jgi:hypothetical protein
MKYKIITILFFLFLTIGSFSKSYAQENEGRLDITVSPPVIELTAKPGEKVQEKFRVRNNLDTSIDLQLSVRRLTSDPTDGNPIPEGTPTGEELKWVSFDKSEFTARPSEWQDITFTIDIPSSAAYGYYYVFRITPKEDSEFESTGSRIKGEVLIVTLLNVKKDGATSKTELVSFKPKNGISEFLPVDFSVKLANKGNVHVKPRGNIFITRGGGKEIGILEVNPGVGSILPGGTREFDSSWTDGFIVKEPVIEDGEVKLDGKGNPVTKMQINWNKLTSLRIGPYEAKLLMVYDDGIKDVTIEGVTTFWVIPYTAIGITIIGIVVLIAILKFVLGMYIRGQVAKSRK